MNTVTLDDKMLAIAQELRPVALKVWLLCLAKIAPEDTLWSDGTREATVPKGGMVLTQEEFAEFCHIKRSQLRLALKTLEDVGLIEYLKARRNSLNYSLLIAKWRTHRGIYRHVYRKTHPEA